MKYVILTMDDEGNEEICEVTAYSCEQAKLIFSLDNDSPIINVEETVVRQGGVLC